jgi:ankyrin repeat protein
LLLNKGANPNAQDYLGNTPLHYVALRGLEITAATLVKKGAQVAVLNTALKTPLHFAVEHNKEGVATILTSNGGNAKNIISR